MHATSNPKRIQIMTTGKELFWKFGFKRVSIEEICREAGVSKMTFYKFFHNKQVLITRILDEVFEESLTKIRRIAAEHESAGNTLRKFLQLKSEGVHGISKVLIKDLYENPDEEMGQYIAEKSRMMFAEIITVYENGKKDGWVREDLNVPFYIMFTQKSIELLNSDEILNYFESSEDLIMEITKLFAYGISPQQ